VKANRSSAADESTVAAPVPVVGGRSPRTEPPHGRGLPRPGLKRGIQNMVRIADISVMARGGRRPNRRYGERLALAAAFSLALFAWGLREIRQAL
jgi:hypothetical protein